MDVVGQYLKGKATLDSDLMLDACADDVVFNFPPAPAPIPKRIEGKPAFEEFLRPVMAHFSDIEFTRLEIRPEVDPERVVAEYSSRGTLATGAPFANVYVELFRVRDGKIVESTEFFDTNSIDDAKLMD
jgi:ketosteroid isomerase-like protein